MTEISPVEVFILVTLAELWALWRLSGYYASLMAEMRMKDAEKGVSTQAGATARKGHRQWGTRWAA